MKYKTPKAFKYLEKAVEISMQQWQKSIDDEKNPVLKMMRQDLKDIQELQAKFEHFRMIYGAEVAIVFPKNCTKEDAKQCISNLSEDRKGGE